MIRRLIMKFDYLITPMIMGFDGHISNSFPGILSFTFPFGGSLFLLWISGGCKKRDRLGIGILPFSFTANKLIAI